MKFIIQILLILRYKKIENMKLNFLIIVSLVLCVRSELSSGEIKIIVSNIEEKKGTIHYGVYNNSELFPEDSGKILGGYEEVSKVIKNGLLIGDLEESNYAIAIFHDKNLNKYLYSLVNIF